MKTMKIDLRFRADETPPDARTFREAEFAVETRDAGDGKTVTVVHATVSSEAPYRRAVLWNPEKEKYTACYG